MLAGGQAAVPVEWHDYMDRIYTGHSHAGHNCIGHGHIGHNYFRPVEWHEELA